MKFIILCLLASIYISSCNKCNKSLKTEDCSFFSECLEENLKCGEEGYPLSFGDKYCKKLYSEKSELPLATQNWLDNTYNCLKKGIFSKFSQFKEENGCKLLQSSALEIHTNCSITSGVCDLFTDSNILKSIRLLWNLYDFRDSMTSDSLRGLFNIVKACSKNYWQAFWELAVELKKELNKVEWQKTFAEMFK